MGSRLRSFGYAFAGIVHLLKTQPNARIHAAITVLVVGLGVWLGLSPCRWAIIAVTIAMVWSAEALNTALEDALDLTHPELHPLAKSAKDTAAAGVLFAALGAVAVGVWLILLPLVRRLWGG